MQEPWQMTRHDYATQWSRKMTELRNTKPHSIAEMYGTRGPTPEQAAAHKAATAAWNKAYRAALKAHNAHLSDQQAHKRAVKAALMAGKPVPSNVLDDYPDLTGDAS